MAHDVFISYSSEDKTAADALCAILESNGMRCWIAPRDIMPGADWGESIVRSIRESRLLLLVFSTSANKSKQIKREIEVAADGGVTIVPLRIENITPTESFKYFLGNIHWMDALTPPLELHLQMVAEKVKAILTTDISREPPEKASKAATEERRSPPELLKPSGLTKRVLLRPSIIIGFIALLVAIGAAFLTSWPRTSGGVDLSGGWSCDDGGTYIIKQVGRKVSWFGGNSPTFQNEFEGLLTKNAEFVEGDWHDLPSYRILGSGKLTLRIETPTRMAVASQTGGFGGTVWTKK